MIFSYESKKSFNTRWDKNKGLLLKLKYSNAGDLTHAVMNQLHEHESARINLNSIEILGKRYKYIIKLK